jgi:hypothetical protein
MNICEHDVFVLQARHWVMYDERKPDFHTKIPYLETLLFLSQRDVRLAWQTMKNETGTNQVRNRRQATT